LRELAAEQGFRRVAVVRPVAPEIQEFVSRVIHQAN
jgi:hypothetical protein